MKPATETKPTLKQKVRSLFSRSYNKLRKSKRLSASLFVALFAITGTSYLLLAGAATPVNTVKSGSWSDVSVWSSGKVPSANDIVTIQSGHNVTYNVESSQVNGVRVQANATLTFAPNQSSTLETNANVIVEGKLVMKPGSDQHEQIIRFINIDESKFVGGGMDPLDTDVGLWVMGSGQLDVQGSKKTSWTRLAGTVDSGASSITLKESPSGWQVGDEIVISPTEPPTVGDRSWNGFHEAMITGISGNTVTLDKPTTHAHPKVNNQWTAEVMNLTRNVRIEGTGTDSPRPENNGRAHILIRSSKPQTVNYVGIRQMGPRSIGDEFTSDVLGRYGLHFHHSMDGSRGSIVEGTVVRDTGGHAFVPHASHGVTLRETISYNTFDVPYWWDPGTTNATHDVLWDRTVAAKVKTDPAFRGYTLTGYSLAIGDGNTVSDTVAVGVQGNVDASGYQWSELGMSIWEFTENNIAHNNKVDGIFAWQNNPLHVVENYTIYHNGEYGIDHGAYLNHYIYDGITLFGNRKGGIKLRAVSGGGGILRFNNLDIDGAGISPAGIHSVHHVAEVTTPTQIRNANIKNHTKASVWVEGAQDDLNPRRDLIDIVNSTLEPNEFLIENLVTADSIVRVQPSSGQPFALRRADQTGNLVSDWNARRTNISKFAPDTIGTGTGLRGEYFDDTEFSKFGAEIVDPQINYYWWNEKQPHHTINPKTGYSIRWTGQIQPQYSETYTFHFGTGGTGARLWINGQLLDDQWGGRYPATSTSTIALQANQKYDIRIDFRDTEGWRSNVVLEWSSPSLPKELVAQSQLYPSAFTHDEQMPPPSEPDDPDHQDDDMVVTDPEPEPEPTPDPEPTPAPSFDPADINQDGVVNLLDFSILASKFGQTGSDLGRADINGDGRVDLLDFSLLAAKFGQ